MNTRGFSSKRNVITFIIFITFLLVAVMFSFAQDVNIPDSDFKTALLNHDPVIDIDGNMEISVAEAEAFTGDLIVSDIPMSSAEGVEAFINADMIYIQRTNITSIDLSNNTAMTQLFVGGNDLTSLTLQNHPNLETVIATQNELTSLDVTGCPALELLFAYQNPNLTSVDLSQNPVLSGLQIYSCNLSSIDVSNNPLLGSLYVQGNNLTSVDISANPEITHLLAYDNSIETIDVRANRKLTFLWVYNNELTSILMNNGNNYAMEDNNFKVNGNSGLSCVLVDDASYSSSTWTNFDAGLTFSDTYCDPNDFVYIPDTNFKAALVGNNSINTNEDSEISFGEAEAFTGTISTDNMGIADATGIEAFPNIYALLIRQNDLTELDVSNNTVMEILRCDRNDLSSLDLSNNLSIFSLAAFNNQLTEIVFPTENSQMSHIELQGNMLISIDVTNLPLLDALFLTNNNISELDISNNPLLERLVVDGNNLTEIDLSNHPEIYVIYAPDNDLQSLNVKNGANENITSFDVTGNANLECVLVDDAEYSTTEWTNVDAGLAFADTYCDPNDPVNIPDENFKAALVGNSEINTNEDEEISYAEAEAFTGKISVPALAITDLTGIQAFINLTELEAYNNQINEVDLSANTALTFINLSLNNLTSLDVSNLPDLELISAFSNAITGIDVSQNQDLTSLYLHFNDLSFIDVNENIALANLNVSNNDIEELYVDQLVNLVELSCANSSLQELDVTNNPLLRKLYVNSANLTSLDLSQNPELRILWAHNNQLTSLNVQNGANELIVAKTPTANFRISNNSLTCVRVDDVTYSTSEWTDIDEGVTFSDTYCDPTDPVFISDAIFKAALVGDNSINTNEDAEISYEEAEAFTGTIVVNSSTQGVVSYLTGVVAFINH
ncbi:MAG: hypothetical protein RIF46_09830 [Cyclobacteriaceae bacterium]